MPSRTQRYHVPGDSMYDLRRWSPADVLDLLEDGRCVGYAHSRGRKCHNRINYMNASEFSRVLDDISEQRPDPEQLQSDLMVLARLGLCRHVHQYQVEEVVKEWMSVIRATYPIVVRSDLRRMTAVRQQLSHQITDVDWITASSTSASTPTSTRASTASLSESTEVDSLRATIATMQETIRSAQECIERLSDSRQPSVQPLPITRVSTSDISSLALSPRSTITTDSSSVTSASSSSSSSSRSSTPPSIAATRASSPSDTSRAPHDVATANPRPGTPATSSSSASSPESPAPAPSTSSEPASPPTPSLPRSPCTTTHARRLPLSDHCPICQTGPALSTLPPSSVVWCKSSCGQSLHSACFSRWARQCTGDGRTPTCVMCRADWVDECDCQGCLHVPRREVEGHCAICMEVMEGGGEEEGEVTVWCKDGCGRSVHRVCFGVWEAHCVERGTRTTCVLCRAEWNDEGCGC